MGMACSTNGGVEECILDIGGKARRKETTGKTKMDLMDRTRLQWR
jgi:hypothetical protein